MRIGTTVVVGLRRGLMAAAILILALFAWPAHADSLAIVITGGSRHFLPARDRRDLNQAQHVTGLQLSDGRWTGELASYIDSYGCSSTLGAVLYRRPLLSSSDVAGGVAAGPIVTRKCSSFSGGRRTYVGLLPAAYLQIGRRVQLQAAALRSPWSGHWLMYWQVSVSIFNF